MHRKPTWDDADQRFNQQKVLVQFLHGGLLKGGVTDAASSESLCLECPSIFGSMRRFRFGGA